MSQMKTVGKKTSIYIGQLISLEGDERTMINRTAALKIFRIVHLYLGVLTAPAILFFALTGALQTFSLHDAAKDGSYKPAYWIAIGSQLHKKQTIQLPAPKDPPKKNASGDDLKPQKKPASGPKHNILPMKISFLVVSISLFFSTLTGLYMSYMHTRNKVRVAALFFVGIAIPVALAML